MLSRAETDEITAETGIEVALTEIDVLTAEAGGELIMTSLHTSSDTGATRTLREVLAELREVINCKDNRSSKDCPRAISEGSDSDKGLTSPEISGAIPKRDCAGSYRSTERDDERDVCNAAASSSDSGGRRIGAVYSRDDYTLRPEAGSTSYERLRNELRLATGSGFLEVGILSGMRLNTMTLEQIELWNRTRKDLKKTRPIQIAATKK